MRPRYHSRPYESQYNCNNKNDRRRPLQTKKLVIPRANGGRQ